MMPIPASEYIVIHQFLGKSEAKKHLQFAIAPHPGVNDAGPTVLWLRHYQGNPSVMCLAILMEISKHNPVQLLAQRYSSI